MKSVCVQMTSGEAGQMETFFLQGLQNDQPIVWGFNSGDDLTATLKAISELHPDPLFKVAQGKWTGNINDLEWKIWKVAFCE